MFSQEEVLNRVLSRISDAAAEAVTKTVVRAVRREVSSAPSAPLEESELHRLISKEIRNGLQDICKETANAPTDENAGADASRARMLFKDAARQLEEIMRTTLEATEKIMTTAEKLLEQQQEAGAVLARLGRAPGLEKELRRLGELNRSLATSLTCIITDLSFHDLTGQRLEKVIASICSIREAVFDLYVSTGNMLKTRENTPEKDLCAIAAENGGAAGESRASELKGPSRNSSQKNVDDLLADLGL